MPAWAPASRWSLASAWVPSTRGFFIAMKRFQHRIELVSPSGEKESWTLCSAPTFLDGTRKRRFNKKDCGHTDWVNQIVTLNSRMRNFEKIHGTLLHEISHVTTGQNASEEFAINLEHNFFKAIKSLEQLRDG